MLPQGLEHANVEGINHVCHLCNFQFIALVNSCFPLFVNSQLCHFICCSSWQKQMMVILTVLKMLSLVSHSKSYDFTL